MLFFSIIIPLYNKEDFIKSTLQSVFEQTFTEYEIIIVDDGSTDASIEEINKYNDARIKIITQKNQGAAAARNKGIEVSGSNLIVFLDADDIWLPNHLEELKKLYNDFPDCGIFCNRYKTKVSNKKLITNSFSNSIPDNFRGIIPDFFEASLVNRVALTSCVMIHKKMFLKFGDFDTTISSGQDLDLWVRIGIHKTVAISNKTTVIYRHEVPNSLSKTNFLTKNLIDLKKYKTFETQNKSLKKFLDIYRLEYALQYRIAGDIATSDGLKDEIKSRIPLKTRILLNLPIKVLRILLKIKHKLKSKGVNFTIYH